MRLSHSRIGFWNGTQFGAACAWMVLLAAVLIVPRITSSSTLGDDLTRHTVRLALAYYAIAASLMLVLYPEEWLPWGRGRMARLCWTLGWLAYLIHLAMAFHYYHRWSHTNAMEHTEEISGFGAGIYFSYAFTFFWSADVIVWWLWPTWYAARPRWIDVLLHSFMTFIIFNGTVVYEQGLIRWAGVLLFAELAVFAFYRWIRVEKAIMSAT